MKLNTKKCAFGMREGTFLGYKVDANGLRVSLDKVKAVLDLSSPKCLKDVQKLNRKLASLNRFLSKSMEKSMPLFKTLKKCTKKSNFQWTPEAEEEFKEMKQVIAELLMLTVPKVKEELIIYLVAAKEAIRVVLMTERDGKQVPIYFISHSLQGLEINYTTMEKLILALYRPRTSVKGQILADFIVERPEDGTPDTPIEDREELPDPWILFTDGSSCVDGSGAGLIIMNLKGMEFTYALSFREKEIDEKEILAIVEEEGHAWMTPVYKYLTEGILPEEKKKARTIRCKAGRYAVINEVLYKKSFIGPWLRCVGPLQGIDIARLFQKVPTRKGFTRLMGTSHYDKSSNGETSVSLTYGAEAVIPAEIGMPTLRTTEVDMAKNNKALGISLDLLEKKREQAAIQNARNKAKMKGYYNAKVRSTSFRPGDFVYQNNETSHWEDGGMLGPKWEGPYEVTKALSKGAYRLRDRNRHTLPRT
nr:reverse transcriptase domain-containing protein [Tanacetum cinerariifolium]